MSFACENVTNTDFAKAAIASLIRDEFGYFEEDFPNDVVSITLASYGGRNFGDGRRRLVSRQRTLLDCLYFNHCFFTWDF